MKNSLHLKRKKSKEMREKKIIKTLCLKFRKKKVDLGDFLKASIEFNFRRGKFPVSSSFSEIFPNKKIKIKLLIVIY